MYYPTVKLNADPSMRLALLQFVIWAITFYRDTDISSIVDTREAHQLSVMDSGSWRADNLRRIVDRILRDEVASKESALDAVDVDSDVAHRVSLSHPNNDLIQPTPMNSWPANPSPDHFKRNQKPHAGSEGVALNTFRSSNPKPSNLLSLGLGVSSDDLYSIKRLISYTKRSIFRGEISLFGISSISQYTDDCERRTIAFSKERKSNR